MFFISCIDVIVTTSDNMRKIFIHALFCSLSQVSSTILFVHVLRKQGYHWDKRRSSGTSCFPNNMHRVHNKGNVKLGAYAVSARGDSAQIRPIIQLSMRLEWPGEADTGQCNNLVTTLCHPWVSSGTHLAIIPKCWAAGRLPRPVYTNLEMLTSGLCGRCIPVSIQRFCTIMNT